MRTTDDLRRAMADETEGLGSRLTVADVRAAAGRRRLRSGFAVLGAALVPVVAAGTFAAVQVGGPTPAPTIAASAYATVPIVIDPRESLNPSSQSAVDTGLTIAGGEHLVLWYDQANGVLAGLRGKNGDVVRRLDSPGLHPRPDRFDMVYELEDRDGGLIDYGAFGRPGVRVTATADGRDFEAATTQVPSLPGATLFWVRRTGVAARPPGAVDGAAPDATFRAVDGAVKTVATTEQIQRSDGAVMILDTAQPVGDPMHTTLVLADGGQLVFWFDGDATSASLHAGSLSGITVKELKNLGRFNRPPFDIGFYHGLNEFALAGGGKVTVGEYVGTAPQARLRADGQHGSLTWSAHPQLRIVWTTGVLTGPEAMGETLDQQGNVLGSTSIYS